MQWKLDGDIEQKILRYRIHFEQGSEEVARTIVPTLHRTYELTGLRPFTEYTVSVEAILEGQSIIRTDQILVKTAAAGI